MQESHFISDSFAFDSNVETPRKEGLTTKLRQKINVSVTKPVQDNRQPRASVPELTNLTTRSQELILRAVDTIRKEDSENVMSALDETRDILRNSYEEFKREQEEYRKQLEEVTQLKDTTLGRRKENAIPLSIIMRQKYDVQGLADLRPNSGMNQTYQAYFEALLTTDGNDQQHPSDKAAVVKYIRRRERRKRAEENKQNHQLPEDVLEKKTAELMEKMGGMDIQLEHQRQRQNEILRARMNEKKTKSNNLLQANEILDQANEADLVRQRFEQSQREKIEARLTNVRHQQARGASNMIHVHSRTNGEDDELDEEQIEETKKSLQLLDDTRGHQSARATTPIYGDRHADEQVADIHI